MTRMQFAWTLVVAGMAGLVGGAVSPWIMGTKPAVAQDRDFVMAPDKQKGKVIKAKEFRLIGEGGKTLAKLKATDDREMGSKVTLSMYDGSGKERVALFAADRASGVELRDAGATNRIVLSESSVGAQASRGQLNSNGGKGKPRVKFDLSVFGAMTALVTNASGAGMELVASVFKDAPFFRLVGRGGSQVWLAKDN